MVHAKTIDLHVHSIFSDGRLTPDELVARARRNNVVALAITDHDTVRGSAEKRDACLRGGMEYVSGVEISCDFHGREAHILSLFADPESPGISCLEELGRRRETRMEGMLAKLSRLGILLEKSELSVAEDGVYGRPHLARALMAKGVVKSVNEAFSRFLHDNGPVCLPKSRLSIADGVELAKKLGGVPVLAHPGVSRLIPDLDAFAAVGLEGVECYHPKHDGGEVALLIGYCKDRGLLVSGGSDFHGPGDGPDIGSSRVPLEVLEPLRETAMARRGLLVEFSRKSGQPPPDFL